MAGDESFLISKDISEKVLEFLGDTTLILEFRVNRDLLKDQALEINLGFDDQGVSFLNYVGYHLRYKYVEGLENAPVKTKRFIDMNNIHWHSKKKNLRDVLYTFLKPHIKNKKVEEKDYSVNAL